jgi:hypothetical protein
MQATLGPVVPAPDDDFGAVSGMRIDIRQLSMMIRARILSHLINQSAGEVKLQSSIILK